MPSIYPLDVTEPAEIEFHYEFGCPWCTPINWVILRPLRSIGAVRVEYKNPMMDVTLEENHYANEGQKESTPLVILKCGDREPNRCKYFGIPTGMPREKGIAYMAMSLINELSKRLVNSNGENIPPEMIANSHETLRQEYELYKKYVAAEKAVRSGKRKKKRKKAKAHARL